MHAEFRVGKACFFCLFISWCTWHSITKYNINISGSNVNFTKVNKRELQNIDTHILNPSNGQRGEKQAKQKEKRAAVLPSFFLVQVQLRHDSDFISSFPVIPVSFIYSTLWETKLTQLLWVMIAKAFCDFRKTRPPTFPGLGFATSAFLQKPRSKMTTIPFSHRNDIGSRARTLYPLEKVELVSYSY